MATLRFSSQSVTNTVVGPIAGNLMHTSSGTLASYISGSNTSSISLLIIYKGTIETFPSFSDRSTRASDVLITFTLPTGAGFSDLGIVSDSARYLIARNLTTQTASASGTASWFLLCRNGTTSLTDKGAMLGSVSATGGGGGDLQIPSTAIVSGNNYQSAGLYFNFPQNWTI